MFYWIYWTFWVYLTFMMEKQNPYRLKLSAIVLIIIIFSNYHFFIGSMEIYSSGLLLLIFSYLFLGQEKLGALLYLFIGALIVSIAYVTFHLFEIFDPVWIIFKKEWMMGIVIGYLAILLQKNLKGRLLIVICGTMQGEFLYAFILSKYDFPYPIGAFAYLDACSLIAALLSAWSILENSGAFFQNHFHFFEKAKQKSS
ncbi:YphA family membrane protein [Neobacillus drentensis]|uniref:YphA family membrane protein n=1 Tax=Neobacillus drentensis TaxID=220684 RepID=UPI003B58A85E